jgi:predicted DNA-binding antitoxin AbrB/MazE fold protein
MTTTTVRAVYQNGVLRPERPLPLAEGTPVDVMVTPAAEDDEVLERMKAARTLEELFAIADSIPADEGDDGYDVVQAMNETRRAGGERLLTRENEPGPVR